MSLVTCDLFTGIPKEDLLDLIDEDITWANAPRATVRVVYPPEWGVSPQFAGFGDIRLGYDFDVGFTPNQEYALLEWRAYETELLRNENGEDEWLNNPIRYLGLPDVYYQNPAANPFPKKMIEGIILPVSVSEGGGSIKVTVKTTKPITLIPFCRAQPRIVRTTPANKQTHYARGNSINISFAAPLHTSSFGFNNELIRIFRQEIRQDADGNNFLFGTRLPIDGLSGTSLFYNIPVARDGNRMIVINPSEYTDESGIRFIGPPANSEITVELYRGIATEMGSTWQRFGAAAEGDPVVSLTWRIKQNNCFVKSWNAKYENGAIDLEWEQERADSVKIRVKRSNTSAAAIADINISDPTVTSQRIVIPGPIPNERFDIWVDLTSDDEPFPMEDNILIWAIQNMEVNSDYPAVAITNDNFYTVTWRLNDTNQIYVLDETIVMDTTRNRPWTPVGNSAGNAFKGTFYGLDNTITFSSIGASFNPSQYTGFFGYADGAKIYNLDVSYDASMSANHTTGAVYMGGLVGYAAGNTVLSNSYARGGNNLQAAPATQDVYIGGLVGYAASQVVIENSAAAVNVRSTSAGEVHAGGLAGYSGGTLKNSFALGNVAIFTPSGTFDKFAGGLAGYAAGTIENSYTLGNTTIENSSGSSGRFAGGLVGYLANGALRHSFANGAVSIGSGSGSASAGGISGYAEGTSSINNTVMLGSGVSVPAGGNSSRIIGDRSGGVQLANNFSRSITAISPYRIPSSAHDSKDGTDTLTSRSTEIDFWTSIGFSTANWNLNRLSEGSTAEVLKAGHPLLIGVGYQELRLIDILDRKITKAIEPEISYGSIDGPLESEPGSTVSFVAKPAPGYRVASFSVVETNGSLRPEWIQSGGTPGYGDFLYGDITYTFSMPNYDVTVTATFAKITRTIPINTAGSGTYSFTVNGNTQTGNITAEVGDVVAVTAVPAIGWKLKENGIKTTPAMTVTMSGGEGAGNAFGTRTGTFTLSGFTFNTALSVIVEFEKITHEITPTVTGSGTYTFTVNGGAPQSGIIRAQTGDTVAIIAAPTAGWKLKENGINTIPAMTVTITGGQGNGNVFGVKTASFEMSSFGYNQVITASIVFEKILHTLSTSTIGKGVIEEVKINDFTVNGAIEAKLDDTVAVTAEPAKGWKIKEIRTTPQMTITMSGGIGTDSAYGKRTGTFTMGGFVYNQAITIIVEFEKITHTFTPGITPGGTGSFNWVNGGNSGTGAISAQEGDTIAVTANPNPGWRVSGITAEAVLSGSSTPIIVSSLTGGTNHDGIYYGSRTGTIANFGGYEYGTEIKITIEFVKIFHRFTPTVAPGGSGSFTWVNGGNSGTGEINAQLGDSVAVTALPAVGWRVSSITARAVASGGASTNIIVSALTGGTTRPGDSDGIMYGNRTGTFTMGGYAFDTTVEVTVTFAKIIHRFTPLVTPAGKNAGSFTWVNGGNSGTGEISAVMEDTISITAVPNTGWRVNGITARAAASDNSSTGINVSPLSGGTNHDGIYYGSRTGTISNLGSFVFDTKIEVTIEFVRITHRIEIKIIPDGSGEITALKITPEDGSPVSTGKPISTIEAHLNDTIEVTVAPINAGGNYNRVDGITITAGMDNISQNYINAAGGADYSFKMGSFEYGAHISLDVEFVTIYEVEFNGNAGNSNTFTVNTNTTNPPRAAAGDEITIQASPNSANGYRVIAVDVHERNNPSNSVFSYNNESEYETEWTFTMPAYPVKVEVTFSNIYDITRTASTNGTYTINGANTNTTQIYNQQVVIAPTPISGYRVDRVFVYKTGDRSTTVLDAGETGPFSFAMKDYHVTVEVTFSNVFNITHTASSNGTYTVNNASGNTTAVSAQTVNIVPAPAANYRVDKVFVFKTGDRNTPVLDAGENGTFSFTMPAYHVTVEVTFTNSYNITHSSSTNGSYTINGADTNTTQVYNQQVVIAPAPDSGYRVDKVFVFKTGDRSTPVLDAGETGTFSFTMPNYHVTVEMTFSNVFNITHTTSTNGSYTINSASGNTTANSTQTVTIAPTPNPNYRVNRIFVHKTGDNNTTVLDAGETGTFSFTMPDYHVTVEVTFTNIYNITHSSSTNGSYTINGADTNTTQVYNQQVVIAPTPASGYRVDKVFVFKTGDRSTPILDAGETGPFSFAMKDYHVTVEVTFSNVFNITHTTSTNGSYTINNASGNTTANSTQTVTIAPSPNPNYRVNRIFVHKTGDNNTTVLDAGETGTFSFTMPDYHVTVEVTFTNIYNITHSSSDNGSYTVTVNNGTNTATATYEDTVTITPSPNQHYRVDRVFVYKTGDSTTVLDAGENGTFTFTMPAHHVTVVVTFTNNYNITHTETTNGSYTVTVNNGANTTTATYEDTVTITPSPNQHYRVESISVYKTDNQSETETISDGGSGAFIFTMPAHHVTVEVKFTNSYNITHSSPTNGSYTVTVNNGANTTTATYADTVTITPSPNQHYRVENVSVFNTNNQNETATVTGGGNGPFSFTMPAHHVTVEVTFERIYEISVNTPNGGTIIVDKTAAAAGELITITPTPDNSPSPGWRIKSVEYGYDGGTYTLTGSGNTFTFNMPAFDVNINAEFERLYSISESSVIAGGTFSIDKSAAANGEEITITTTPDNDTPPGWRVKYVEISYNSTTIKASGANNIYTFDMPSYDVTVNVVFEQLHFILTSSGYYGKVTAKVNGNEVEAAAEGESVEITAAPAPNFRVDDITAPDNLSWTKNYLSGTPDGDVTTTFTMPSSNVNIGVTFVQTYTITGSNVSKISVNDVNITRGALGDIIVITSGNPPENQRVSSMTAASQSGNIPINWLLTTAATEPDRTQTGVFVMPGENVSIALAFGQPNKNLSHETAVNGKFKTTVGTHWQSLENEEYENIIDISGNNSLFAGDQFIIIASPEEDYRVKEMRAEGTGNQNLTITKQTSNISTFITGDDNYSVIVEFEEMPCPLCGESPCECSELGRSFFKNVLKTISIINSPSAGVVGASFAFSGGANPPVFIGNMVNTAMSASNAPVSVIPSSGILRQMPSQAGNSNVNNARTSASSALVAENASAASASAGASTLVSTKMAAIAASEASSKASADALVKTAADQLSGNVRRTVKANDVRNEETGNETIINEDAEIADDRITMNSVTRNIPEQPDKPSNVPVKQQAVMSAKVKIRRKKSLKPAANSDEETGSNS